MNSVTESRLGFFLNRKVLYFIICLLGMISATIFYRTTNSCAAAADDDDADFGIFMPVQHTIETTIADISKNETILGMTRWDVNDEELLCITTDGRKFFSGHWMPSRHLRFYKEAGAKLIPKYEYETMDRFSSSYSMEEPGGRLLTVWNGSNVYHIVIFAVVGKTLKVALMTGSKALPEIANLDNDGVADILIWGRCFEVDAKTKGSIRSVVDKGRRFIWQSASIYKWDDNSYVLIKKVPWLTRLTALQNTSP